MRSYRKGGGLPHADSLRRFGPSFPVNAQQERERVNAGEFGLVLGCHHHFLMAFALSGNFSSDAARRLTSSCHLAQSEGGGRGHSDRSSSPIFKEAGDLR